MVRDFVRLQTRRQYAIEHKNGQKGYRYGWSRTAGTYLTQRQPLCLRVLTR